MYLNDKEKTLLRWIAERFEVSPDANFGIEDVPAQLGIEPDQLTSMFQTLLAAGALACPFSVGGTELRVMPTANSVQLCRQYDAEQSTPPDFVAQILARFRRNPAAAAIIALLIALAVLIPVANGAIELWQKLFGSPSRPAATQPADVDG